MKIDVIIPTFNRAQLIQRALDSVLNQSYQDFIVHVVDDGSTDKTLDILKSYSSHSRVKIHTQKNSGVSAARNFGVKNSQAQWIAFLDSDDEWLPEKLDLQVNYLGEHPEIRFLHGEEIWMRNGVRVNPKVKHDKSTRDIQKASLEFCLISPSTVMMKRDLFNEHRGFDESLEVCEDFDLWNKVMAREEIGFLPQFVTKKYGGHEDQLSTKFVGMDYWRIRSLIHLGQDPELSEELQLLIKHQVQAKAAILLKGYLKHNHLQKHDEVLSLVTDYLRRFKTSDDPIL